MKEIDPQQTKRARAFELWMRAPLPMVTLFKKLEVANLLKIRKKSGYRFNMLMCWCIGKAASQTEEFYLLPVGEKLYRYDKLAVSLVVETASGEINTCDVPFRADLESFNAAYIELTKQVYDTAAAHNLSDDYMVIGTSALARYDIDGAVNLYSGFYNNPFLIWGRYDRKFRKATLKISLQFHHAQMDGLAAARFLERLQKVITELKV